MNRSIFILVVRYCVGMLFLAIAGWLFWDVTQSGGHFDVYITVCFATGFLILAAIAMAPPVLELIANMLTLSLFLPDEHGKPRPRYSIPESRVKQGKYEEAIELYEEIADHFPDEARPYIDMIDIATNKLHDSERAKRLFQNGLDSLNAPDQQEQLRKSYRILTEAPEE
ncbi:MAG: tetratricopeptide repeat protein [Candidatus Pacebacteria bacterium]|nr:tetratricopeptide repeat protein [Candidatus Paceibacterota bacterium]